MITSKESELAENIKDILSPLLYSYGVKLEKFIISKVDYDKTFLDKINTIRKQAVFQSYSDENKVEEPKKKQLHRCQVCGSKNDIHSQFCSNCGSKVVNEIICANCEKKLPVDANFCTNCGTKVEDS